jgi:hypothetical protein
MLLNNIKAKHPASQIVAMDWTRGVAVVEQSGGGLAAVQFDHATLQDQKLGRWEAPWRTI